MDWTGMSLPAGAFHYLMSPLSGSKGTGGEERKTGGWAGRVTLACSLPASGQQLEDCFTPAAPGGAGPIPGPRTAAAPPRLSSGLMGTSSGWKREVEMGKMVMVNISAYFLSRPRRAKLANV